MMKAEPSRHASPFEVKGRHVAIAFVAFFGTIFVVNILMLVLAKQAFSGLIAKNGYVASHHLKLETEARTRALASGWSLETRVRDGIVHVTARVPADTLVEAPTVRAESPVNARHDVALALVPVGGDRYEADRALPRGRWTLITRFGDTEMGLTDRREVTIEAPIVPSREKP